MRPVSRVILLHSNIYSKPNDKHKVQEHLKHVFCWCKDEDELSHINIYKQDVGVPKSGDMTTP